MVKFSVLCVYFAVAAVNFWNVNCDTEEDKQAVVKLIKPIAEECASDCGLTEEDYNKGDKTDDMDPCFKTCLLKELGLLNEKGKYDRKLLRASISQYTGDKDEANKFQDRLDSCFDANGDNTGDDEDSQSKRAEVLFNCLNEMKE